jgi:hypothetical protein
MVASAISHTTAAARGYRSVAQSARLAELGFGRFQAHLPALQIPIWTVGGDVAWHQSRPDKPRIVAGKAVKYETPRGCRMVLDVPPPCRAALADPSVPLWITEGVRKADAAASVGLCCIDVIGVWAWRGTNALGGKTVLADWESVALNGRLVFIAFDSDVVTKPSVRRALERLAEFLRSRGAKVQIVVLPPGPDGAKVGLDDYLAAGHSVAELTSLVWIVQSVASAPAAPNAVPLDQPRSVPAQSLRETLDATVGHLTRFVHFARPEHADAVTLWAAHTHADLALLAQSPILALTSAVKQSGKSRVLDVLEFIVRAPWRITRPSEAVLFRKIDKDHPTVLLDEIDAIFGDTAGNTEGIRSLFNSGNRRGTKVPRVVAKGKTFEFQEFDVFSPKATAGIGGLPDTILDRAIVIEMQRRTRGEPVEKLRERTARAQGIPLRDALAYHVGRIEDYTVPDDTLPWELDDRAQDGWEALIAIADAAGGDWPARARRAAVAIFGSRSTAEENLGLRLLADCREVFEAANADFLTTTALRSALLAVDQSVWVDIRGRDVTTHKIGKLLRAFEIQSTRTRPSGAGNPVHGYYRTQFVDAWNRYGDAPPESGTSGTSGTSEGFDTNSAGIGVPDVPDVPDAGEALALTRDEQRQVAEAAFRLFAEDDDWLLGLA